MSRALWQQRILESVFFFYTEDLKHALIRSASLNLTSQGAVLWPEIASKLKPFFVAPDRDDVFVSNVPFELYKLRALGERHFDESLQAFLADQPAKDAAFMKRMAAIPATDEEIAIYIKAAHHFETLLDNMGDDEIVVAYRQLELELAHVNRIQRERHGSERDKFAFFSELPSDARFDYWLQMAGWNANECVALSLGKEPTKVNPETLKLKVKPRFHSPFREEFKSRLEIIQRAQMHGSLPDLISPKRFVSWALELRWSLPTEVERALARKPATDVTSNDTVLSPSPSTVYRLLLGMAITRFEHRTDRNSSATAQIEDELHTLQVLDDTGPKTLGKIAVKNDSIRKALEAAAAHLDASWSETIRWTGVKRPISSKI